MRSWKRWLAATLVSLSLFSGTALAHGFGSRYELSLPQWMFIGGGVGVVVVSFALVSVFAGSGRGTYSYSSRRLAGTPLRLLSSRIVVGLARVGAVVLLVVGVVAGLVGPQDFNRNLLTNLVWVGWWVGYTFSVIFVGNTWPVVNPWKTVYEWVESLLGSDPSLSREYGLANVPVLVLFLVFAWLEIIAPFSANPRPLAGIVLVYSIYLWGGMLLYGKDVWLEEADPFTRLYRYLGKFAPLSLENGGELRMYGVGLVPEDETLYRTGALAFLITVLYSVTFDGYLGTPEWRDIALAVPRLPVPYLTSTLLMLVGLVGFVLAYHQFSYLIARAAGTAMDAGTVARRFGLTLLPIAIVYQVSHFYTFLLVQGQFLVLALADPFGLGWNLLGLGGFEPSAQLPFLSVQFVWGSQVGLILLGHVVAVWVAHHVALDLFPDRRTAIRSQVPMMALMIVYTMLSLWILTFPVVEPPLP